MRDISLTYQNFSLNVICFDADCPNEARISSLSVVRRCKLRTITYWVLSFLSLFTLNMIAFFYPKLAIIGQYTNCSLYDADYLVVSDLFGGLHLVTVDRNHLPPISKPLLNYLSIPFNGGDCIQFTFRYFQYVYCFNLNGFVPLTVSLNENATNLSEIPVVSASDNAFLSYLFGKSDIIIEVKSYFSIILETINDFFYFFQAFACIVWLFSSYYIYLLFIFSTTLIAIVLTVTRMRKNMQKIAKIASHSTQVKAETSLQTYDEIESSNLTVGMKFKVPTVGETLPCDCILIEGNATVSESCLTGEADPVGKEAIKNEVMERNVLYCGSVVVQVSSDATAVCHKTSFNSRKGKLMRSILLSEPTESKFEKDSMKYIKLMFVYGVILYFASLRFFVNEAKLSDTILRFFDIITVTVPPALPACLTIGILIAVRRLKTSKVKCTQAKKVTLAGRIDKVIFDKTGTLTVNELNLHGIVPWKDETFGLLSETPSFQIETCLSVCHSLVNLNGQVAGDAIERLAFSSTNAILEGNCVTKGDKKLEILERFEFCPIKRSMGVLVETESTKFVYFKGSPEEIVSRCSQIPIEFSGELEKWTTEGYRVLGLAAKKVSKVVERDEAETELNFLGLLIVKNPLKPEASKVIETLRNCDYPIIMCTGDNVQTALSVARQSGILENEEVILIAKESIAILTENQVPVMTGEAFSILYEQTKNNMQNQFASGIINKCKVFARMAPDEKQNLIKFYKENKQTTFFIGDGANDCGALRESDVGLSLSLKDSSFAAPFNCESLSGTIEILIQGKSSLCASIECFKYMMAYSTIQSYQTIILQAFLTYLADSQFLSIDLFAIIPISFALNYSRAARTLRKEKVQFELFSRKILLPYAWHNIIVFASFLVVYEILNTKDWFVKAEYSDINNFKPSYENTSFYLVSYPYYIAFAFVIHIGEPLREKFLSNKILTAFVAIGLLYSYLMFWGTETKLADSFLSLVKIDDSSYLWQLTGVSVITIVLCYLGEKFFGRVVN